MVSFQDNVSSFGASGSDSDAAEVEGPCEYTMRSSCLDNTRKRMMDDSLKPDWHRVPMSEAVKKPGNIRLEPPTWTSRHRIFMKYDEERTSDTIEEGSCDARRETRIQQVPSPNVTPCRRT